jgi:PAS domain-containing protein
LVGKHIWTEFPAGRGSRFQRAYERAMNESERVDFVEHSPAPLDRWYDVRAYPSVDGVSVYFHDITEKREAEAQYQRKSAQLELIVRGANVGVWYCPLPFDELVWDAKVREHFFLAPEDRVTIDTFYERLHPDDREPTREAIRRSVERCRRAPRSASTGSRWTCRSASKRSSPCARVRSVIDSRRDQPRRA